MKIRRSMLERVLREELKNILAEKALLEADSRLDPVVADTEISTDLDTEKKQKRPFLQKRAPRSTNALQRGIHKLKSKFSKDKEIDVDTDDNIDVGGMAKLQAKLQGGAIENAKFAAREMALGAIAKATGQDSIKPLDVATMKADFEADLPAVGSNKFETAEDRAELLGRFDSYVSPGGDNRKAWIRRLTTHVFADGTDPKLIEAHYDNVMMPSILKALKTPIVKGHGDLLGYADPKELARLRNDGYSDDEIRSDIRRELGTAGAGEGAFNPGSGEIATQGATPDQWAKGKTAGHEIGHALSTVETFGEGGSESEMLKYYQEKGMIRDDFDIDSLDQLQTQSAQHKESFDAIFKPDFKRFASSPKDHEAQEEFYSSIIDGIEKVGGDWSADNVLALLTGTGPFKYGDQGNDMKEFIRAFTPSGHPGNPGVLRDDHQLVVDNFYNVALKIREREAGPAPKKQIGMPAVYNAVMKSSWRDELMDSDAGKAFTEMLNTLAEAFGTFAALEPEGEVDEFAVDQDETGLDPNRPYDPAEMAESKKKGSEMEILFEGWRKFIE